MAITIQIPTALREFTDRQSEVRVEGATVSEAIASLACAYPDIRRHLFDDGGKLRSFINLYLGDTNIRNMNGVDTPVSDGDAIMMIPAIAGGGFQGI
ncbi:MAG: MoaD/ThiS family protein [Clostridiales bacterium]|jgi:molybdopterin converting factor small subunit|nr:MoaD/ThiS family protein [Clostridiales bacterium]